MRRKLPASDIHPKATDYCRVVTSGVPGIRSSQQCMSEAEAKRVKREILMAYPSATVSIVKLNDFRRAD